ncbi:MAG: DsbA family oxidoreductase [Frankiales bacterium]|nr:DsbA family oxidoreductase [Frankiales bacterium]
MRVEIWSDVVCPWCYVGKRRFEQALASFPHRDEVEVVWRSFELDPSAPAERTEGQAAHLAAKYGRSLEQAQEMLDSMTATAAQDGLDFRFDLMRGGSTFDAHRLLHLAAERGVQGTLKERLMRATFTEGEPTSDHETLVRLAGDAGLDTEEARDVLSTDRYADEVRADVRDAQRFGITGVPFFVVDRTYGVSGAQPAEVLRQVLDKAWEDSRPVQLVTTGGSGPGCEGDACTV